MKAIKDLKPQYEFDEMLIEWYFGVGLGITRLRPGVSWVIILPFVMIMITEKQIYR